MLACDLDASHFSGAEVLRGAFTDFYTGPVYSVNLNCSTDYDMYSLSSCTLTPGSEMCGSDASRAVGFRCVRGKTGGVVAGQTSW